MSDDKEELIDLTKMNQKEMLVHVYKAVGDIKDAMSEEKKHRNSKNVEFESRLKILESESATQKGVRIGLSIAVTLLSITAIGISIAAALN